MNLIQITIQDFMSWSGTQTVRFQPGLTAIEGNNTDTLEASSNGAGKSSLLYAICWALWGRVPPGGVKNSVIHHGAPAARVQLDVGGLRILRTKPADGSESLKFWWTGTEVELESAASTQKRLEAHYGISWEVFCNTVYIGDTSDTTKFMRATPSERARILGAFVQDAEFQEAAVRVAKEIAELEGMRENYSGQLTTIQATVTGCLRDIERLNGLITKEELEQAERTRVMGQEISEKEMEILRLTEFLKNKPAKTELELLAERNALQAERDGVYRKLVAMNLVVNTPDKAGVCLSCGQLITADTVARQKAEKEQAALEISKLTTALAAHDGTIRGVETELQRVRQLVVESQMSKNRIDALRLEIATIQGQIQSQTLNYLLRERDVLAKRVQEHVQNQNAVQTQIGLITQRIPILKVLQVGFKTEIRNMLLDELRTTLAYYSEQYRYVLAGNEFSITFPPTTESGQEKFEIVLLSGSTQNQLTSGGETDRAQLSILLALRKALLHGKKCPFEFLLIDDPIGKLDDQGSRAFFELLSTLTGDFSNILVTIPRTILGVTGIDHQYRVTRRARSSKLEEVS